MGFAFFNKRARGREGRAIRKEGKEKGRGTLPSPFSLLACRKNDKGVWLFGSQSKPHFLLPPLNRKDCRCCMPTTLLLPLCRISPTILKYESHIFLLNRVAEAFWKFLCPAIWAHSSRSEPASTPMVREPISPTRGFRLSLLFTLRFVLGSGVPTEAALIKCGVCKG